MGHNDNTHGRRRWNRRNVLKGVSAGVGGVAVIPTLGSANNPTEFNGADYDTLTGAGGHVVSGDIGLQDGRPRGVLRCAGYEIVLHDHELEETKNEGDMVEFAGVVRGEEYEQAGVPLNLKIGKYGHVYAGILRRPSVEFGSLGFTLFDKDQFEAEDALAAIRPDPPYQDKIDSFDIPRKGLPTDSGVRSQIDRAAQNRGDIE